MGFQLNPPFPEPQPPCLPVTVSHLCPHCLLAPPVGPAPAQPHPLGALLGAPHWTQSCSVTVVVAVAAAPASAEEH